MARFIYFFSLKNDLCDSSSFQSDDWFTSFFTRKQFILLKSGSKFKDLDLSPDSNCFRLKKCTQRIFKKFIIEVRGKWIFCNRLWHTRSKLPLPVTLSQKFYRYSHHRHAVWRYRLSEKTHFRNSFITSKYIRRN